MRAGVRGRGRTPGGVARAMTVAGVMSGTSADGIDVAFCRIAPARPGDAGSRVRLLGHRGVEYPRAVRAAVLAAQAGKPTTPAELGRLSWRLGELYAEAVEQAGASLGLRAELVGCHGQTVHHESTARPALGARVRSTWQMGEAAPLVERLRCPVVSDFRPADLAAGGQGAPLVPMLDVCLLGSARVGRILQNIGGIGNLTAIPAGGGAAEVLAFDTGPGNMVIDQCMTTLYGRRYDRDGAVARRGRAIPEVMARLLRAAYFSAPPPKSCGREQFGPEYARRLMELCRARGAGDADVVATATALTVESIREACRRFALPHLVVQAQASGTKVELVVAGGGARNGWLMHGLGEALAAEGVKVIASDELGMPTQAKEAAAFALLAWLSWHGLPGNVPAATGAERAVVLGKIGLPA